MGHWDDDNGRMPDLPEQGAKVVAQDWDDITTSAWFALREHAEVRSCQFVLSKGTYRRADPSRLAASLLARNALLTQVATGAISSMGNSWLLEGKGFWPRSEKPNSGVPSHLWKMATACIELINSFLVEDEESLQCLYCACERELRNAAGDMEVILAAQERIRLCLRNARSQVLAALEAGRLNEA